MPTDEHPIWYLAQERAMAPGIVKEWPVVIRQPRKMPNGRLVRQSHAQVIHELEALGYHVVAPAPQE